MAIYRAIDFVDAYRVRALSSDINDMSGRDGRADITLHISRRISEELMLQKGDSLVDVGCGDGTLLRIAIDRGLESGHVVGVLPTEEEVKRVKQRFANEQSNHQGLVVRGLANDSGVPSGFASKCVCNGVLLLMPNIQLVQEVIAELVRITSSGGLILIGEIPELNEAELAAVSSPASTSAIRRAYLVMKRFGVREVCSRLKNRLVAQLGQKLVVIAPATPYWSSPVDFEALAGSFGLTLKSKYRSPTLSLAGHPEEYPYRWNYIFVRA